MILLLTVVVLNRASYAQKRADIFGITDTVAIEVTMDLGTFPMTGKIEIFCFNDSLIVGGEIPISWDNSDIQMDSVRADPPLEDYWNIFVAYWEAGSIDTTNANQRFHLGGVSRGYPYGIPGNATGRHRLATYYFSVIERKRDPLEAVTFDIALWSRFGAGHLLVFSNFISDMTVSYRPHFTGPVTIILSDIDGDGIPNEVDAQPYINNAE